MANRKIKTTDLRELKYTVGGAQPASKNCLLVGQNIAVADRVVFTGETSDGVWKGSIDSVDNQNAVVANIVCTTPPSAIAPPGLETISITIVSPAGDDISDGGYTTLLNSIQLIVVNC